MWPFKKKKPVDPRPTKLFFTREQCAEIASLADAHSLAMTRGHGTAVAHHNLWWRIDEMYPDRRPGGWTLHLNATPMFMTHEDHPK